MSASDTSPRCKSRAERPGSGPTGAWRQSSTARPCGLDNLLDAGDYRASQDFGDERRAAGSNGIMWPSIRFPGRQYIGVFWPDGIPIPTQGAQFACHWNGAAVDYAKQLDSGEPWEVR
ncbi:MAG: RES family NAD+ phosphorylase [Rhodobacteraceae bacterium]|nr:RES family NAD+ phosphorylase [Paracoccaceae bacterium]MCZ8085562.1 RES family NAD+ phosphorylase [Paracoccaceae bacterium]